MCCHCNSVRVILSLGANLGNRLENLERACDLLEVSFGDLRLSQLYETEALGCPDNSPPYLNAAVELYTQQSAQEILHQCQAIEQKLGRTRSGIYGEARSCDIDIISYGEERIESEQLQIPHPRAHERAFVLQAICDIDPSYTLVGQSLNVSQLLNLPHIAGQNIHAFNL